MDFGTWAESLRKIRPTKPVEDKLAKIHEALKSLSANYKLVNAPNIREESERKRQALRDARAQHSQSTNPPSNAT
nr:hypothetical protein [Streptomyces antimycoticus]